jgi:hypothetical protein
MTTMRGQTLLIAQRPDVQRAASSIPATFVQEAIGEAASDHGADLCHLTRWAEPVEPRHQRLLQRRRDRLDAAASLAALQKEPQLLACGQHPSLTLVFDFQIEQHLGFSSILKTRDQRGTSRI